MEQKAGALKLLSWSIAVLASALAFIAWYSGPRGGIVGSSGYTIFPLLGLIAFGLMWSHYMVAAVREGLGLDKSTTKKFTSITSWIVLVAILLHPGILIYSLWRDGFGLPPASYLEYYVAPSLKWAAALGSVAFLFFLAYELHRWLEDKKWWFLVQRASDAAMLLIIVHGFKLGAELQQGWFRIVWFMYAATYAAALSFIYYQAFKRRKQSMLG